MNVDIQDVDEPLSHYLEIVEKGETVVLCRDERPVAEIRPVSSEANREEPGGGPVQFGLWKGMFELGPEFFEPLSDEMLACYNGEKK